MRTGILFAAAGLACLAASHACAQTGETASSGASSSSGAADLESLVPPEMRARYAHAHWTYPNATQMADAYPPKAQAETVSGMAVIACAIAGNGSITGCKIVAEDPKSYGFGYVTAQVFIKFTHVDPASVEGGIRPGDYKLFKYYWKIG
ncbi:MAG: hypothetical protein ACXU8U_12615 [Asticcacaulis sp.]